MGNNCSQIFSNVANKMKDIKESVFLEEESDYYYYNQLTKNYKIK